MRNCIVTRGYASVSPGQAEYASFGPELAQRDHETHVVTADAYSRG